MFINRIDAGYMAVRKSETFNFSNEKDSEYGYNEDAYVYVKMDGFTSDTDEVIPLFMTCVNNGKTVKVGNHDFTYGEQYYKYDIPISGEDSELYVFSNIDDFNADNFDKAIIHESIKYKDNKVLDNRFPVTELRDGINVKAGFYDGKEFSNTDSISYVTEYNISSHNRTSVAPIVVVDGLEDGESIELYVVLRYIYAGGEIDQYDVSEIEDPVEFTKEKNFFISF